MSLLLYNLVFLVTCKIYISIVSFSIISPFSSKPPLILESLILPTDCPSKFGIPSMNFCSFAIQLSLTSSYSLPAVQLSPPSTSEQVSSSVVVTHPRTIKYKGRWRAIMMSQTCHPIETRLAGLTTSQSSLCETVYIWHQTCTCQRKADSCPLRSSL